MAPPYAFASPCGSCSCYSVHCNRNPKQVCQLIQLAYILHAETEPAVANQTQSHRPVCHTWPTTVQCVTNIFYFLAWGITPGPKFTKIGDDLLPTRSTVRPNFTTLCLPTLEISTTKISRRKKETNNK